MSLLFLISYFFITFHYFCYFKTTLVLKLLSPSSLLSITVIITHIIHHYCAATLVFIYLTNHVYCYSISFTLCQLLQIPIYPCYYCGQGRLCCRCHLFWYLKCSHLYRLHLQHLCPHLHCSVLCHLHLHSYFYLHRSCPPHQLQLYLYCNDFYCLHIVACA